MKKIAIVIGIICLAAGCTVIPRVEYRPGELLESKLLERTEQKGLNIILDQVPSSSIIEIQVKRWTHCFRETRRYTYEATKWHGFRNYHPLKELYEVPLGAVLLPLNILFIFAGDNNIRGSIELVSPFLNASPHALKRPFGYPGRPFIPSWGGYHRTLYIMEEAPINFKGPYPCPGKTIIKVDSIKIKPDDKKMEFIKDYTINFYIFHPKSLKGIKKSFRSNQEGKVIINLTPWLDKIKNGEMLSYNISTTIEGQDASAQRGVRKNSQDSPK